MMHSERSAYYEAVINDACIRRNQPTCQSERESERHQGSLANSAGSFARVCACCFACCWAVGLPTLSSQWPLVAAKRARAAGTLEPPPRRQPGESCRREHTHRRKQPWQPGALVGGRSQLSPPDGRSCQQVTSARTGDEMPAPPQPSREEVGGHLRRLGQSLSQRWRRQEVSPSHPSPALRAVARTVPRSSG